MDRRRLNKLNDNMDPIPIFALRKQMTIALNNLKLTFANKYQAHVFFFDSFKVRTRDPRTKWSE